VLIGVWLRGNRGEIVIKIQSQSEGGESRVRVDLDNSGANARELFAPAQDSSDSPEGNAGDSGDDSHDDGHDAVSYCHLELYPATTGSYTGSSFRGHDFRGKMETLYLNIDDHAQKLCLNHKMDSVEEAIDVLNQLIEGATVVAALNQGFEARYMFLLADYKAEYYWWDCIEMLRKVLLTGFLSILGPVQAFLAPQSTATGVWAEPGSKFQLLVGIVTSIIFGLFVATLQPYRNAETNTFKVVCDSSSVFILVLATMLKDEALTKSAMSPAALGLMMLLCTIAPFCWFYGVTPFVAWACDINCTLGKERRGKERVKKEEERKG